jgi:hypothetical protein
LKETEHYGVEGNALMEREHNRRMMNYINDFEEALNNDGGELPERFRVNV